MKVSIITVAYNSASTIKCTLQSVAKQKYNKIEHLVIDGLSTDNTLSVVHDYISKQSIVITESDDGIYDAMNKGIKNSSGEVIGILNSDDFYIDTSVISEVVEIFESDPSLDLVLGGVDFVQSSDLNTPIRKYSSTGFKPWMFRFGFMPPHPAVFIKRSSYNRFGLYKTNYRIAADFDLLLRLILVGGSRYKIIDREWVRMRTGGASTSSLLSNFTITIEMRRSLKENNIYSNFFFLILRLPIKFILQIVL